MSEVPDTYVLRKSVEGYSAGTVVEFEIEQPRATAEIVTVHAVNDNYIFDVPITDLVKRRPRTSFVPENAGKRRAAKKAARREKLGKNES